MPHIVRVFTFKEGLLSRVAHDLRLSTTALTIAQQGADISATVDPHSLIVDGVMHGSRLDPRGLGGRDRAKVLQTMRGEVLAVERHPPPRFEGTVEIVGAAIRARGRLRLAGVERPLTIDARRAGGRITASVSLRPSDHGIRPYKALAGAIRLQDRVRIELDLDADAIALRTEASPPA